MSETEQKPVPPRELSPNERQFPKNEEGEEVPHEIEMVELETAHVGREVQVSEPGKPSWFGTIDGWTPEGVYVKVAAGGNSRFLVSTDHLAWVV